jgi:hypothetical protein
MKAKSGQLDFLHSGNGRDRTGEDRTGELGEAFGETLR